MISDFVKKHKNDIILISVLLAIALSVLFIMSLTKKSGGYAVVVINSTETQSYPLNKDTQVTLKNGDGYNILVIENGQAYIKEASCPDKLCVKQHEVEFNGEALVCLPNKITVKIVSDAESDVDFIS